MTLFSRTLRRSLPVDGSRVLAPLGIADVSIDSGGYWGRWQEVNATAMIDHCAYWMEKAGWIGNLEAVAAGTLPGARRGREFTDSDVFKLIEAMSWEQGRAPTEARERAILELTSIVGAAQEADGYINTAFGREGQHPRYSDMEWGHELYNYGHLLQAAVARERTAGRDDLFDIAIRVADHICDTFGADGRQSLCGHPEIELALIEFARVTGDERYRRQAEIFIERRGHGLLRKIEYGAEYFQDDQPVLDATVLRGHAVRALYLAAAAVDLAIDRGDEALLGAIELQWENTVRSRTYVTGGMGSHHQDEAFGTDYELPSDRAYCETCAGVGAFMLSWRLLLATGRSRYGDLMERTLFNIIAASPAADGRSFFYANTLHQRTPGHAVEEDDQSPRAATSMRAPWFEVSCCPTNVARTFASLDAYVATADQNGVQVNVYASASIRTLLPDGRSVSFEIETDYPDSGVVALHVPASSKDWTLKLRVPGWADGATVERGGVQSGPHAPGWITVEKVGRAAETIVLRLPMTPRLTFGDPRIDSARGAVAVERGPLVYCVESVDLPVGVHVDQVVVDSDSTLVLDGDYVVTAARVETLQAEDWPYGVDGGSVKGSSSDIRLLPYNKWGRRGPSTMRIWLRTI